jgi:hypothetical protein
MTRATLMPPPPACRRAGAQRSLSTGTIRSTDVEVSIEGLGVSVRMRLIGRTPSRSRRSR